VTNCIGGVLGIRRVAWNATTKSRTRESRTKRDSRSSENRKLKRGERESPRSMRKNARSGWSQSSRL